MHGERHACGAARCQARASWLSRASECAAVCLGISEKCVLCVLIFVLSVTSADVWQPQNSLTFFRTEGLESSEFSTQPSEKSFKKKVPLDHISAKIRKSTTWLPPSRPHTHGMAVTGDSSLVFAPPFSEHHLPLLSLARQYLALSHCLCSARLLSTIILSRLIQTCCKDDECRKRRAEPGFHRICLSARRVISIP
jgi:hypothetical protein